MNQYQHGIVFFLCFTQQQDRKTYIKMTSLVFSNFWKKKETVFDWIWLFFFVEENSEKNGALYNHAKRTKARPASEWAGLSYEAVSSTHSSTIGIGCWFVIWIKFTFFVFFVLNLFKLFWFWISSTSKVFFFDETLKIEFLSFFIFF